MNRPSEELLHKTLENSATPAEAALVAEWLATDSGQAWASRYIGRDFDRQEECGDYEQAEVASDRIFARIKLALTRGRRRRILFRVAAVVIPVALILAVALRLDRQVGGIFSGAEYSEFVVDRGRRTQCLFQDGTVAYLNSESKIHYPVKFGLFERRIRLEGEAYFEVKHNSRRPFVVEFEGGEIQVLGTSFNVKAYRGDDIVAVTLDEGRVVLDNRHGGRFRTGAFGTVALRPSLGRGADRPRRRRHALFDLERRRDLVPRHAPCRGARNPVAVVRRAVRNRRTARSPHILYVHD